MSLRSEVIRIFSELIGQAKKITDLPALPTNVDNDDLFEVSRGGTSYKGTGAQLPSGVAEQDLQSVLDEGPEATLDAGTVARVGIALNNDDQERVIEIDADGPRLKYVNGVDTLEVSITAGGIGIGGTINGVTRTINFTEADGITTQTPPTDDDSTKIATTEHVKNVVIGIQDLFISASAMWPRTTNPCSDLTKTEIATSLFNIQSLDFDQTTQEFAQFQIVLPRKWDNGTVTAVFYWTAASGSGDVQWGISGGAYSNDDALTVAFGTPQTVDDTLIATNDLHITSATSAITLAGTPADADFLAFQISRNPASDTLSGDAKLLGVSIRVTTNAAIDA